MKTFLILTALLLTTPAYALSPLKENVDGKMLPVTVDEAAAPYYNQLTTEQRLCDGKHPKAIRVIHEGDMITQDFSASRLNIVLDKQDNILRSYCG